MNERTKQGLNILEAALLLGLLGDALLRATPWGLNVLLWIGALVAAAFLALPVSWHRASFNREGRWLALPALFFAATLAWRDSFMLNALSVCAVLVSLALGAFSARGAMLRLAGMTEYALGLGLAAFDAMFGVFPLVLMDVRWKEMPHKGWSKYILPVLRGLFIAAPLLFIFLLLFMAADAVFEKIVSKSLQLNVDQLVGHIFLALVFAWMGGGFLRGMLLGGKVTLKGIFHSPSHSKDFSIITEGAQKDEENERPAGAKRLSLGIVEIGIVLGLMNLLFLSFVIVQIRYFFGGAALVLATTGLTYAEYARRGFFELVTVAALVLPILLIAHWLLRRDNPAHERIFRVLAGLKVALLFVIMASAMARMRLYQSEYGLTELRVYTTAFMGWLALVFVWFVWTVLRGRRERFACGALVAGFLIVALLHFFNPDASIVRANMNLMRNGHDFDASYAISLSADAVPVLVQAMPAMSPQNRCLVASTSLVRKWLQGERPDWRTWNWSRSEARRSVLENSWLLDDSKCSKADVIPVNSTEMPADGPVTIPTRADNPAPPPDVNRQSAPPGPAN